MKWRGAHDWIREHKGLTYFAVLIGLLVLVLLGVRYRAQWELARYKEQLIARGEKLTFGELIQPIPTGSNGGSALVHAAGLVPWTFVRLSGMKQTQPGVAMVVSQEKELVQRISQSGQPQEITNGWPTVEAQMSEYAEPLRQLRAALDTDQLYFEISSDFNASLPHLSGLLKTSAYLTTAAIYELHTGDQAQALDTLCAALSLLKHFHQPIVISQIDRCKMGQRQVGSTWEALQWDEWTDPQLQRLQSVWQSLNDEDSIQDSARLERIWGMQACDYASESYGKFMEATGLETSGAAKFIDTSRQFVNSGKEMLVDPVAGLKGMTAIPSYWWWCWVGRYHDERALLTYWQDVREQMQAAARANSFSQAVAQFESGVWNSEGDAAIACPVTKFWVSGLGSFTKTVGLFKACRELAVTAIALKRFHLRQKKYPSQLAELIPLYLGELPRDIFNGQTVRYECKEGRQFLLYSVGPDGVDDGGDPKPLLGRESSGQDWLNGRDLVWPRAAASPK